MKWLYGFVAIVLVALANAEGEDKFCYADALDFCTPSGAKQDMPHCNAIYGGFDGHVNLLQSFANDMLAKSYDYLLMTANHGSYTRNRPGFEKQFRSLSDKAFADAIDIIKYITQRGGTHNFAAPQLKAFPREKVLELDEINSMALALDMEKKMAEQAISIHKAYSHANHATHYDPTAAHYMEEKFLEDQSGTIRKLSGYTNDLKRLINSGTQKLLNIFLFDEYLAKE